MESPGKVEKGTDGAVLAYILFGPAGDLGVANSAGALDRSRPFDQGLKLFAARVQRRPTRKCCRVPARHSMEMISSRTLPEGMLTSVTSLIRLPSRLFPMGETFEILP